MHWLGKSILPNLKQIFLGENDIDDKGMRVLSIVQWPQL